MIKRIRPPYLMILFVALAIIGALVGASAWRTRRSPEFYEGRGDRLVEAGEEALAALQYAVAAMRTTSTREQSRLLLKRGEALGHTRRESLLRVFEDAVDGAKAIEGAMFIAPELYEPSDTYLGLQYRQTDLVDTLESWQAFSALLAELEANAPENLALRKYRALANFRLLCRQSAVSDTALASAREALAECLEAYPDHLDLAYHARLAKLILAQRLAERKPDEARALREAAARPWSGHDDGLDDLRQADANVLGFLAKLTAAEATPDRSEELQVALAAQLGLTPSRRARFRASTTLLHASKTLPAARRGPPEGTPADLALQWLRELHESRHMVTLATYVLLLNLETRGDEEALGELLGAHYERIAIEEGLFERTLGWRLSQAASRYEMKRLFAAAEEENDRHALASLLARAGDEMEYFRRLRELDETPDSFLHFFQGLVYSHDLQSRRALQELLRADELAEGADALVKLATGTLLLELGEGGAAVSWLEGALPLRGQLFAKDTLRLFARLADAYLAAERYSEAERLARELSNSSLGVDGQVIVGRIWRELSLAWQAREVGRDREFAPRAVAVLLPAAENAEANASAAYELASAYLRLDEREAGEEWLNRALQRDPAHTPALRALATLLVQQPERHDDLAAWVVDHIERQALFPELARRGQELVSREGERMRFADALDLLAPTRLGQKLALYASLNRDRQPQRAGEILAQAVAQAPNHERVVRARFEWLVRAHAYDEVLQWIDPVERPLVPPSLLYVLRGELELLMRQPYNAIEQFTHALRSDSLNSKTHFLLGQAQRMALLNDQASASFNRSLELNPGNPGVLHARYDALQRAGREDEAQAVLLDLSRRVGRTPAFLRRRFDTGEDYERSDFSMTLARRPVEVVADDDLELRELALASHRQGDRERVRGALATLLADETKPPRQWLAIAEIVADVEGDQPAVDVLERRLRPQLDTLTADEALAAARLLERHGARNRAGDFHRRATTAAEGTPQAEVAAWERVRWLIAEGRVGEAKREAERVLSADAFPDAFSRFGRLFARSGHWLAAIELLRKGPPTVEILSLVGEVQFAMGDVELGASTFARAIELSPRDPRPYIWRARAFLTLAHEDANRRAEVDLRQAIGLQPDLSQSHVMLAEMYEQSGRFAAAERVVADMVQRWPNREAYRLWRCRLALSAGRLQVAASGIATAGTLNMTSPEWGLLESRLRALEGDLPAAAEQILDTLIDLRTPAAIEFSVDFLLDQGFTDEAAAILDGLASDVSSFGIQLARAVVADRRGDERACLSHLQKALLDLPKPVNQEAFIRMARVVSITRLARLADEALQAPEPNLERIQFLAAYAEHIGAYRAGAILARALAQAVPPGHPAYIRTRLFLANIHRLGNQPARAEQVYLELLNVEPDLRQAQNNLAYLYATQLNRPEKAKRGAALALANLSDGDPRLRAAFLDTLALAQMELAEYDEAEENLLAAGELTRSPEILAHRGLLASRRGDAQVARRLVAQAWQQAMRDEHGAREAEGVARTMRQAKIELEPHKRLALARKFAIEGKVVTAGDQLTEIPSTLDADPEVAFPRMDILLALGQTEAARQTLQRLVQSTAEPTTLLAAARFAEGVFPIMAVSLWRDLAGMELAGELREAVGRHLLQAELYAEAAAFHRAWLHADAPPEAIVGYLVACLATGDPPSPELRPALTASPGGRLLLAVFDGELERVMESVRFITLDRAIAAKDLVVAGRYLQDDIGARALVAMSAVAAKAVELAPTSPTALALQADVAEAEGQLRQALTLRQAILRVQPLFPAAVHDVGRLHVELDQTDALRRLLRRYHTLFATRGWYQTLQGEWAALDKQPALAEKAFERAFAIDDDAASLYRLAMHRIDTDAPSSAATLVDAQLDRFSTHASLLSLRARAAFAVGDVGGGVAFAARTLAVDAPTRVELENLTVDCPPDALGDLVHLGREREIPAARLADLLAYYFRLGERLDDEVLGSLYEQTSPGSPVRRQVELDTIRALLAEERVREAGERLRRLALEFPDDPDILERRANFILHHEGGASAANNDVLRAIELAEAADDTGALARALTTHARILLTLELINPAQQAVARSVRLDPQPENLFLLAEILADQGVWLGARSELQRALAMIGPGETPLPQDDVERLRQRIEQRRR